MNTYCDEIMSKKYLGTLSIDITPEIQELRGKDYVQCITEYIALHDNYFKLWDSDRMIMVVGIDMGYDSIIGIRPADPDSDLMFVGYDTFSEYFKKWKARQ